MVKLANHPRPNRKLVPLSYIKAIYEPGALARADLLFEDGGYVLCLHTENDLLWVARRDGDKARNWRSIDRALGFVRLQFGHVETIILIHPTEEEILCEPQRPSAKAKKRKA